MPPKSIPSLQERRSGSQPVGTCPSCYHQEARPPYDGPDIRLMPAFGGDHDVDVGGADGPREFSQGPS